MAAWEDKSIKDVMEGELSIFVELFLCSVLPDSHWEVCNSLVRREAWEFHAQLSEGYGLTPRKAALTPGF